MERVGGVFGNGISPKNSNNFRPAPPLSAIDRFLWGKTPSHFSHQNKEIFGYGNGVSEFSSNNSYSHRGVIPIISTSDYDQNIGGLVWESLQTDDGVFIDGSETQNWDMNPKQEEKTSLRKKRVKGGYPSNLIKGQWTDEEDRKLIRLVKQFGVRKWAQIAEKMFGRAGKQCRERWQNHLRPDIKKDTWNEEEEKMLVEAHQNVGNKWAEIAKRIPGRSENSIKNHWNATKRRQNSRRKSKKNDGKSGKSSSQSSLLQDYIKSKLLEETNNSTSTITTSTITTSTTTPTNSTISDDPSIKFEVLFPQSPCEDSTSLITPTYDDELNFMQRLFATNSKPPLVDDGKLLANSTPEKHLFLNNVPKEVAPDDMQHICNNVVRKQVAPDNIMQPDHYLAFLLDGGTNSLPQNADYGYNDMNMDFEQMIDQASSSGTNKEMDLIELVLVSQFSHEI